ncbi:hypothetical protein [Actinopolymorpha alba]|uniref:hypothetical protein n=1 Tax=Actinopolymorpha alba TaxID=533267 RepID=UPI00037CBDD2|nr:hypothetical protein [Actinopolymorpha alba]
MSEYQYYQFLAVDQALDDRQLAELRALSTRATITPTSFVNTYDWGNFRGNPSALMEKYFDAFLYLANWGTRQLMIRLPSQLLDLDAAQAYCPGEAASVWAEGDHVILALASEDEDGDFEYGGDGWLASIIPVRGELAAGDRRLLYLAWLLCVQAGALDDDEVEPPVPAGLTTLSASLRAFVDFLRLDEDLLAVASEASPQPRSTAASEGELRRWIEALPAQDKDALLLRMVRGDDAHVSAELVRRFHDDQAIPDESEAEGRMVGDLLLAAERRSMHRARRAKERQARERDRQERAAVVARDERLRALAAQEEPAWQRVSELIDTKKPKKYDEAVALLTDLRALGEREGRVDVVAERLDQLRRQHHTKPSLLERFARAGL